jgi:very-short-patch-repair endonuclease
MVRRARLTLPQFPQPPKVPATPLQERRFRRGGLEFRPFAGPDVPIPATEDEDFLVRFEAWHAATNGSLPEYIVYEFLVFKKRQREGLDFQFQRPFFGGRTVFGGFVADFVFQQRGEVWQINGERYHLLQARDRARDRVARAEMTGRGFKVLALWEQDLLVRPGLVLNLAWERSAELKTYDAI